jgi:hypothetical protein
MATRDLQAQAFSTVIEPNFDGGLIHNDWIKGTIFIKITRAQRNAIGPLFRSLQDDNTTACLVIEDGVIYKLINNPTTQGTTDNDWAPAISVANADTQIIPIGTWDINNTSPVLQDIDANGINGNFYYVQGAPNKTDVTIPGLFQSNTIQVINNDWIISVGTYFVALSNTTTWENLNRPQSIRNYENGIVISHTHSLSEILGLLSALSEKYDANNLASMTVDFVDVPDSGIGHVAFLRRHFYDKTNVYNKNEIEYLLSLISVDDFQLETTQTFTVTDENYTTAFILNTFTNVVKITLDATLTNDWQPATITGWIEGRTYTFIIIKESNNSIDLSTARAVPNVGYDDDIDPFAALIDIDTTQKRAVIQAIGFKSTFGQFGRLILTDENYFE